MAKYYKSVRFIDGKLKWIMTDKNNDVVQNPTKEQFELATLDDMKFHGDDVILQIPNVMKPCVLSEQKVKNDQTVQYDIQDIKDIHDIQDIKDIYYILDLPNAIKTNIEFVDMIMYVMNVNMIGDVPYLHGTYIVVTVTGKLYVGATKNLHNRIKQHFSQVNRGTHIRIKEPIKFVLICATRIGYEEYMELCLIEELGPELNGDYRKRV